MTNIFKNRVKNIKNYVDELETRVRVLKSEIQTNDIRTYDDLYAIEQFCDKMEETNDILRKTVLDTYDELDD